LDGTLAHSNLRALPKMPQRDSKHIDMS
jgi:hypothetical protein